MSRLANLLGTSLNSQISVHSVQDDRTFATGNGALVTLFQADGLMRLQGRSESVRQQMDKEFQPALAPLFQKPGHGLQWNFSRDPRWAERDLERHVRPLRITARKHGMGTDLVDSYRTIEKRFVPELSLVALWTYPTALLPHEIKKQGKERDAALDMKFGEWQVPNLALPALPTLHNAMVDGLEANLVKAGFSITPLDTDAAVLALRRSVSPRDTSSTVWSWKNRPLFNDTHLFGIPIIGEQVLPSRVLVHEGDIVESDGLFTKVMTMKVGPSQTIRFVDLVERMAREAGLPWSYSIAMVPSSGSFIQGLMSGAVASILTMTNKSNKLITDADALVKDRARHGDYLLDMRVNFSTWGDTLEECQRNARRLEHAIRSWGSITVEPVSGDPVPQWLSMTPGLRMEAQGQLHTPNLSDSLAFLPVATPASPWSTGSLLLRSPDGKIMPVQNGSELQDDFVTALSASPGKGKSVLVAMMTMAHLLEPGHDLLPMTAVIDIGYSSFGTGTYLQDALGDKAWQVTVNALRQDRSFAVNPFDTQLGFRQPLPQHRSRLVEMLVMLCTPVGLTTPPEDLYETIGHITDMVYDRFSDETHDGSPKRWSLGQNPEVDAWVRKKQELAPLSGYDARPIWWRIVDDLFDEGNIPLAASAQRYAVPTLPDLIQIVRDPEILARFGKVGKTTEFAEGLIDKVARYLEMAVQEYPLLSHPTVRNMGAARVNILDLNEVTAGTGPDSVKRTSVMYLAARFAATGHWYVNPKEDPPRAPERYRAHHLERMQEIFDEPKFVVYDEFHRTGGSVPVRRVIDLDAREGRKYNIRMVLSSQRLADYDEEFLGENCSTKYILSAPEDPSDLITRFQLNAAEAEALTQLRGPSANGSNILCLWSTKKGPYRMLLSDPVPLEWLWAFSTTSEDRQLLRELQKYVDAGTARVLAAARFGASAKKVIESRRVTGAEEGEVVPRLAKEVVDAWNAEWAGRAAERMMEKAS